MGPIALIVVLWLLPIVAAVLFLGALALYLTAQLVMSAPAAFWMLTTLTVTVGAVAGLRIGRRLGAAAAVPEGRPTTS